MVREFNFIDDEQSCISERYEQLSEQKAIKVCIEEDRIGNIKA
jgi:hypothetical protein